MKLFKLKCGCVGMSPRPIIGSKAMKFVRLHSCKTRDFCFEEVVTSQPIACKLTRVQAVVCMGRITDLVQGGLAHRKSECSHA